MAERNEDRRYRRSKEVFHEVLLSLLERKSFEQITVKEIVEAADFNRGTFYTHYEQKEDLLNEMIDEMLGRMVEAYRQPYKGESILDFKRFSPQSIILFDYFLENRRFYKGMLSSSVGPAFRHRMTQALDRVFREDTELDVEDIDPELDVELFFTYRTNGIIGLILTWIEQDFKESGAYLAEQIIRIFQVCTPKIFIKE